MTNGGGLRVKNSIKSVYYFIQRKTKKLPLIDRKCSEIKGFLVKQDTGVEQYSCCRSAQCLCGLSKFRD
jgi:hypothetical protein